MGPQAAWIETAHSWMWGSQIRRRQDGVNSCVNAMSTGLLGELWSDLRRPPSEGTWIFGVEVGVRVGVESRWGMCHVNELDNVDE